MIVSFIFFIIFTFCFSTNNIICNLFDNEYFVNIDLKIIGDIDKIFKNNNLEFNFGPQILAAKTYENELLNDLYKTIEKYEIKQLPSGKCISIIIDIKEPNCPSDFFLYTVKIAAENRNYENIKVWADLTKKEKFKNKLKSEILNYFSSLAKNRKLPKESKIKLFKGLPENLNFSLHILKDKKYNTAIIKFAFKNQTKRKIKIDFIGYNIYLLGKNFNILWAAGDDSNQKELTIHPFSYGIYEVKSFIQPEICKADKIKARLWYSYRNNKNRIFEIENEKEIYELCN
jgi:hypothetical protein